MGQAILLWVDLYIYGSTRIFTDGPVFKYFRNTGRSVSVLFDPLGTSEAVAASVPRCGPNSR